MTDLSDIVFDENERSVPCEACDGDGVRMLDQVSLDELPEDRMAVCRACDGWGWREP